MKKIISITFVVMLQLYFINNSKANVECLIHSGGARESTLDVSNTIPFGGNNLGKWFERRSLLAGGTAYKLACYGFGVINAHSVMNSSLPVSTVDGGWVYHRVDDYFSIALALITCKDSGAVTVFIPGYAGLWCTPSGPKAPYNLDLKKWNLQENSEWIVRIRVDRPFSGPRQVNSPRLVKRYIGEYERAESIIQYLGLSGTITVPETCTINAGQIIQVNLGDVGAGRFGGKGQKPDGYTPVTTSAPVTCNDAAAQRNVRVSLAATPSPDLNTAIRTSNPDVGVVVTDLNDRVVQPNVGTLPLRLQSNGAGSNDGTVTMKAYPVSTTGRPPAQGNFSATAAITVTFD
ncbi:TPA: fimbrial protein [Enterobacter asburiae]